MHIADIPGWKRPRVFTFACIAVSLHMNENRKSSQALPSLACISLDGEHSILLHEMELSVQKID